MKEQVLSGWQRTYAIVFVAVMTFVSTGALAQTPPNLGTAATYGAFSGNGAIGNTGLTIVTGDIGTYVGSFTGFPPGQYTGAKHVADPAALAAKNDLTLAYNSMNDAVHAVMFDTALSSTMGNGQVLTPRTYGRGDLTTMSGNLTFDAKGNSAAVFIVKIRAALNIAKNTTIILANGAQAANIYWAVDGAVSVLDNSVIKATILSNGAIHLYGGSALEGRALAVVGAVTFASNLVTVPGTGVVTNRLVVITPAPGDSIKGGTLGYQITWGGTGIGSQKTFDYSLDSGATWHLIGSITSPLFVYSWNVPDTISRKAVVRITDQNNLRGISGVFVIGSSKAPGSLTVVRPALNESISGRTRSYQIMWSGSGLGLRKTFEYSLDSGLTWKLIGSITSAIFTYSWDVPDTSSTKAVIRITDQNNVSGLSRVFTIVRGTTPGTLIVTRPAAGESILRKTHNYQITWTGTGLGSQENLELSLDAGATWHSIGAITSNMFSYDWDVPDTATITAQIRITDNNGTTGKSGRFAITSTIPTPGTMDSVMCGVLDSKQNIANGKTLGITWRYTPDIGTSVAVEVSLDRMLTWIPITTLPVTELASTSWQTPSTGYYDLVFVRVTSSLGMTATSAAFTIGASASVASIAPKSGAAIYNYPNPAMEATSIRFALATPSNVSLEIYDCVGRSVGTIVAGHFGTGSSTLFVNTSRLDAGVYTYTLQAGEVLLAGRMSVIK